MKAFFLASLLVVASSATLLGDAEKFQSFKSAYGKNYLNQVEETKRFSIFKDNLRAIEEHNALYEQGLVKYKKGINKFTDQTQEEFEALLALHTKPNLDTTPYVKRGLAAKESVDWRGEGQVTEVKDQKNCGACWAFSLTGSIEAAYYRKSGKLVSLSEQQLVDCTSYSLGGVNHGCQGGWLDKTFPYIERKGLQTEESYSYKAANGICYYNASHVVTKTDTYLSCPVHDEDCVAEILSSIGPVSVTMDASQLSPYEQGIYSNDVCTADYLNHAVLIVGYGEEQGTKYWLVKNSWGSGWGENGYFKIVRGINMCGIGEESVLPVIY